MITFKELVVDEEELFKKAEECFFEAARYLKSDDIEEFYKIFEGAGIQDLKVAPARIAYSKNFEIEDLFYFDKATNFCIYVLLYIFTVDEDGDRSCAAGYTLLFDENFKILDDFLK